MLVMLAGLASSCSSSSTTPADAGGDGGSSGGGSSGGGAGASRFVGTWDFVATSGKKQVTGVVTIGPAKLDVTWDDFLMSADVSGLPSVSGKLDGETGTVATTHQAAPLDTGEIPLSLGGDWTFLGRGGDRCTAKVDDGVTTLSCSNLGSTLARTLQDYDNAKGQSLGSGTSVMQRTRSASSIFGALGGEWKVVAPRDECTVTFEEDRMHAECSERGKSGTFDMTFGEGVASGKTSEGLEVSAKRR